ncbi:DivIVA domain-containing protein [Nocardioides sp.]|uniref:DivIVA domain-containing protein n=1 Tax=Nocardioides sp. TaxID=35761 RepID=UPI002CBE54CA|nr:DivIVA domain-containing protein [Nocardioides sp.]HXH81243.1 DivIVA domain-containing protein [Nocardioides sp.]
MMWLFAILVVLAMGGVAIVASGRAGALPEEFDDRPDVRVPAGPLVGDDLRRVRFSLAFRGYRMSEVDTLLARLAGQLDEARDQARDQACDQAPHGVTEPD